MDPVIVSFTLFGITFAFRWYGLLAAVGMMTGAWVASRQLARRGDRSDHLWNMLLWVIPSAVIGARLWYVAQATLGGNTAYTDDPVRILNITEGGLHFFGGLLFGAIALLIYIRKNRLDILLYMDSIAPATLIGQAIARPANFINQELYGQPTNLPWGIKIDAFHRIKEYVNLQLYPVETTRFHPTFAYEMAWNLATMGILLWASRKYQKLMQPGVMFAAWLLLAGTGRALIESFRPDQPLIPGTALSYSRLVSILMALAGLLLLLARFGVIKIKGLNPARQEYRVPGV